VTPFHDRPCAAPGYVSYRYRGPFGWIMIGARDNLEALKEASRSLDYGFVDPSRMEIWNGEKYIPASN
jgi:hypothetical protein